MHFEALRERLLRAGIAPRRVKRYLGELNDHLAELTARELAAGYDADEARIQARALLGSDDDLAQAWLADPRFRSFTARAPWLVFTLFPLLAMIVMVLIQFFGFAIAMRSLGIMGRAASAAEALFPVLANMTVLIGDLLVPPAIAALFVAMAWRQRLPAVWPLIATAIILMLSLHWDADPFIRNSPGWSTFGFGWHDSTHGLRAGFTPILLSAWRQQFPAHALLFSAQYLLTLLPLARLYLAQQPRVIVGEALCQS